MASTSAATWHGYLLADSGLPLPTCVTQSDDLSRPDYTQIKSAEYHDTPEVLDAKAELLIKMWSAAERPLIYAGAGISTSSGIQDYASNAAGSKVQAKKQPLTMSFINALKPTPAHRVLTAMEKRGMVWGWLQQNHDGLAQKAGFPGDKVNELHGCWLNQTENPIIKMSGNLRDDLFEWCVAMEEGCDFVFAVGTSFSGLNADRCAATCAKRHMAKAKAGQGLAIVSIQKTPMDDRAALRVFSRIDDFMLIVANKLRLRLDTKVYPYAAPKLPVGPPKPSAWTAERAKKKAAWDAEVAAARSVTDSALPARTPSLASSAATRGSPAAVPAVAAEPATVVSSASSARTATSSKHAPPMPTHTTLRISNTHKAVDGDTNRHRWALQLESSIPNAVEKVVYHLHPTFTPATVTVTKAPFTCARLGWGTFDVTADVYVKNPSVATAPTTVVTLPHAISFDAATTTGVSKDVRLPVAGH